MPTPSPKPAAVPDEDEDDFDPTAGAPAPAKAPNSHPVRGQGTGAPRGQGTSETPAPPAEQGGHVVSQAPRGQGSEEPGDQGRLTSADRPKLGARVDPWLKRTLKIAAAIEGRKEEALVEQALAAYLWQHHPQLAAQHIPAQSAAQPR